ncbi:MAG: DnaB-like helicase C-terminal domain-containing protein [Beijerinckiaceae bacterium]|nr:DnaB-like helicase C-terminal domain-containing protein [Beijerinckiaceae bacterium]
MNAHDRSVFSQNTVEPPNNLEAEQALIGCVLMNNDVYSIVSPLVNAEAFYEQIHAKIWDVIAGLVGQKKVASPVTLQAYLTDIDLGPDMTVTRYLARLAGASTSPLAASSFASIIADLATRRKMIEAGHNLIAQAAQPHPGVQASHIAGEAISALTAATEATSKQTRRALGESAQGVLDRAKRIINKEETVRTVTTGIQDLNWSTGGYRPGELWLVSGRPGMGKSGMVVASSRAAAASGAGVIVFELELPEEQITARFLAEAAYIPRRPITFGQIMRADLDDDEIWLVEDAQKRLDKIPLVLDVAPSLTVEDIAARVRSEKAKMAKLGVTLSVIFIDQLDFVKSSGAYRGQRVHEVGEVSRGLKTLAKAEDVCIVLFCQLNRGVESRDDKRPSLADLRDSGNLEQDADVVAFLYRESYYLERTTAYREGETEAKEKAEQVKNKLEFILGKNRTGSTKTIEMFVDIGCSVISGMKGGY